MNVPCGKCNFCLSTKRSQWSLRLFQELRHATAAQFLTLTYSDDCMPVNDDAYPSLRKDDFQNFMKRLRKITPVKLRYYAVGEYGDVTQRPHYHIILFNLQPSLLPKVLDVWGQGIVHIGSVTPASIHYVTKYVIQHNADYPGRDPPFSVMSRKPGIGATYLQTHADWHGRSLKNYMEVNGIKTLLPRYYKDKLYSKAQRAHMASVAQDQFVEKFWKDVESLSPYHHDPYNYYYERIENYHNKKQIVYEGLV